MTVTSDGAGLATFVSTFTSAMISPDASTIIKFEETKKMLHLINISINL